MRRIDGEDGFHAEVDGAEDSKEGRLTREVLQLGSEGTRGEGACIVESVPESTLWDGPGEADRKAHDGES